MLVGKWERRDFDEPLHFTPNGACIRGTVLVGQFRVKEQAKIEVIDKERVVESWSWSTLDQTRLILKNSNNGVSTSYFRLKAVPVKGGGTGTKKPKPGQKPKPR